MSKYNEGIKYLIGRLLEYQCSNKDIVPYPIAVSFIKDTANKYKVSERSVRNWIKKSGVIYRFGAYQYKSYMNNPNTGGYIVILPEVASCLKHFRCHPITMRNILLYDLDILEDIIQEIRYRKLDFHMPYYFTSYLLLKDKYDRCKYLSYLSRDYRIKYTLCYFRMICRLIDPVGYFLQDLFKRPISEYDIGGIYEIE